MKKKIIYGLLGVLVLIQLIRPARNISGVQSANEINLSYSIPDEVKNILVKSCYDCHSNNTKYPWYVNIQPIGLWMQNHVSEGKKELNFSEFGGYTAKRARHKLEKIEEEVRDHEMPLSSYLIMHNEARLTPEQVEMVTSWAASLSKTIPEVK